MGCDIHMYVEYKRSDNDREQFTNFGSRINPGRNYYMFGLLSKGVRSDNENGIEPKGLPPFKTLGYYTITDVSDFIVDENDNDESGYISKERAHEYIKKGYTTYTDESKTRVFASDWHSHTWLTRDEYKKQLEIYYQHPDSQQYKEPEYNVMLAILDSFEEQGFESRVVFWFDN